MCSAKIYQTEAQTQLKELRTNTLTTTQVIAIDKPKTSTKNKHCEGKKSLKLLICPLITKINPELNIKVKYIIITPTKIFNFLLNPKEVVLNLQLNKND